MSAAGDGSEAAGRGADVGAGSGDANSLAPFRRRLDQLDEQIAKLLGERFDVCREVALHKREHDIPMMQPDRVVQVRQRYLRRGAEVGLPADFVESLFELLIGATCKLEDELIDGPDAAAGQTAAESAAGD